MPFSPNAFLSSTVRFDKGTGFAEARYFPAILCTANGVGLFPAGVQRGSLSKVEWHRIAPSFPKLEETAQ
jgi:hypothetical protein